MYASVGFSCSVVPAPPLPVTNAPPPPNKPPPGAAAPEAPEADLAPGAGASAVLAPAVGAAAAAAPKEKPPAGAGAVEEDVPAAAVRGKKQRAVGKCFDWYGTSISTGVAIPSPGTTANVRPNTPTYLCCRMPRQYYSNVVPYDIVESVYLGCKTFKYIGGGA